MHIGNPVLCVMVLLSMYARYDAPRREEAGWDETAYQRKQVNVRLQEDATGEMQVPGFRW